MLAQATTAFGSQVSRYTFQTIPVKASALTIQNQYQSLYSSWAAKRSESRSLIVPLQSALEMAWNRKLAHDHVNPNRSTQDKPALYDLISMLNPPKPQNLEFSDRAILATQIPVSGQSRWVRSSR